MSASVLNGELVTPEQVKTASSKTSRSASRDSLDLKVEPNELKIVETPEPETPKAPSMAFTIDFGGGKSIDKDRLENLAKKSQARHQRVQSMSSSWHKASPTSSTPQKAPLSVNLPRKTHGYNSEGYFSSDQEDSNISNPVKHRKSPLSQPNKVPNKLKSPIVDREFHFGKKSFKSPILNDIMSRSDTTPSRQGLNLPLKHTSSTNLSQKSPKTPKYGNTHFSFMQRRNLMPDIIDQSPEGVMLCDISSPELDVSTPDTHISPTMVVSRTISLEPIFKMCMPKTPEIDLIDDSKSDSSTGTYTIEGDNYTEEQKVRMSIDRSLEKRFSEKDLPKRSISKDKDPELVLEDLDLKSYSPENKTEFQDKNVLEITCCYESPKDDLAAQTSKQIKSTRNYLEKIKSRVKNISDKTFQKNVTQNHEPDSDVGSFTSVTTSGVLSLKLSMDGQRKNSLTKSHVDNSDFIHRLTRESSVPVSLPSHKNDKHFESTVLRNAQAMLTDKSPSVTNSLSNLSINRCRGDSAWIQDWAESVKKYNSSEVNDDIDEQCAASRPPSSPKNMQGSGNFRGSYSKIPSPKSPIHAFNQIPQSPDTKAYLLKTESAITNLQAKYCPSKIPQLSRSNSLNYRLKRKKPLDSPLRSPGHYVITGQNLLTSPDHNPSSSSDDRTLSNVKRYDVDAILSPHRRGHIRHRSFDGKNVSDFVNFDNGVDLKTVLKKNANSIDLNNICYQDNGTQYSIKRSTSFNTVNLNSNCLDVSDDSDNDIDRAVNVKSGRAQPVKMNVITPEPLRKFGPGPVRSSVRVTSKERNAITSRLSEPRNVNPPTRKLSEQTRLNIIDRLTRPKVTRDLSAYNVRSMKQAMDRQKEVELSNWKKRSTYDPMRAAMEGRKKKQANINCRAVDNRVNSPVHRSQSFQTSSNLDLTYTSSSDESVDNVTQLDDVMIRSDMGPRTFQKPRQIEKRLEDKSRAILNKPRSTVNNSASQTRIPRTTIERIHTNEHRLTASQPMERMKKNIDNEFGIDKRKTFILESDTNSSSPRNSSIFSQEKSLTNTSDTENESGPESAPVVVLRNPARRTSNVNTNKQRNSGDFTSAQAQAQLRTKSPRDLSVQPRYMDISKYKGESCNSKPLRTNSAGGKGSARQIELEQKSKELEKWKRRASYDPRKAAAQSKISNKTTNRSINSNVLRSQSFHGPMVGQSYQLNETFDISSDNDF